MQDSNEPVAQPEEAPITVEPTVNQEGANQETILIEVVGHGILPAVRSWDVAKQALHWQVEVEGKIYDAVLNASEQLELVNPIE